MKFGGKNVRGFQNFIIQKGCFLYVHKRKYTYIRLVCSLGKILFSFFEFFFPFELYIII